MLVFKIEVRVLGTLGEEIRFQVFWIYRHEIRVGSVNCSS